MIWILSYFVNVLFEMSKLSIKCQQKIIMIESFKLQHINKLSQYSNKYLNYKS